MTWKEGFNYSAINNFGASFASGEYLLLLNNDTELLEPDSIKEMLGFCSVRMWGSWEQDCFMQMTPSSMQAW